MLKWIESTGKSEEAAIEAALQKLGMDRDEVSVEILERARSGFFGIGGSPAKVKVTYEVPDEAPAPQQEETLSAPQKEKAPKEEPKQTVTPAQASPVEEKAPAAAQTEEAAPQEAPAEGKAVDYEARIRAFLTGLLEQMGVEATITVGPRTENGIPVTLDGPKLGAVIGHRGETLDAIQQLTNYSVNRGERNRVRIHVDAEGYREKREQSLQHLARKVAAKVTRYRRSVTLEPMNAYERHVIHTALQDVPGVTTYSTGTEPNRRVIVAYDREKK